MSVIVIPHYDDVLYSVNLNYNDCNWVQAGKLVPIGWHKSVEKNPPTETKCKAWYKLDQDLLSQAVIQWNRPLKGPQSIGRWFLLFTSICPPRKIRILWSLKMSPCILECSGAFKVFSLLPRFSLADFSLVISTTHI